MQPKLVLTVRTFSKVAPPLWKSKRFLEQTDSGRILFLYYLTSPHQNVVGCFPLPDGYAVTDLRWDAEKYIEARKALIASELILFDAVTEEVLVLRWFRHNFPQNPSHRKAVLAALDSIASPALRQAAIDGFNEAEAEWKAQKAGGAQAGLKSGHSLLNTPHMTRVK